MGKGNCTSMPWLCHRPRVPGGSGGRPHCAGEHLVVWVGWLLGGSCTCWDCSRPQHARFPAFTIAALASPRALASLPLIRTQPPPARPCRSRLQVQDGDLIRIDAEARSMDIVGVSDEEMAARKAAWTAPPLKASSGTLLKYIRNVAPASLGCMTDL